MTLLFISADFYSGQLKIIPEPKEYNITDKRFELSDLSLQINYIGKDRSVCIALDEAKKNIK